jgi:hypothetical protein
VAAADHVLLLHGDTVLDEDTVACLVEATTVQTEAPGIVGAKVVDLGSPRELRAGRPRPTRACGVKYPEGGGSCLHGAWLRAL